MTDISSTLLTKPTFPALQENDIEYYASLLLDMKNDSYYESDELDEIIMNYNRQRQSNQIQNPDIGMKVLFSISDIRKSDIRKSNIHKHTGKIVNKGHGFYTIETNNGEIFKRRREYFIVM